MVFFRLKSKFKQKKINRLLTKTKHPQNIWLYDNEPYLTYEYHHLLICGNIKNMRKLPFFYLWPFKIRANTNWNVVSEWVANWLTVKNMCNTKGHVRHSTNETQIQNATLALFSSTMLDNVACSAYCVFVMHSKLYHFFVCFVYNDFSVSKIEIKSDAINLTNF